MHRGDWDYRDFVSLTTQWGITPILNTHRAYREFGQARAAMRSKRGEIELDGTGRGPGTATPSAATIMW